MQGGPACVVPVQCATPQRRPAAMAAADLSVFAEAGFDPRAWVNAACDRRAPRACGKRELLFVRAADALACAPQLPGGGAAGAVPV